jgi:soluble lytic murein transglycosylase-like protein
MASKAHPHARVAPRSAPPTSDGIALVRLTLTLLCLSMLFSTIAPLRGVLDAVRNTVVTAIEVSRSSDANRVAIAGYAIRYRIPYDFAATIQTVASEEGIDPDLAFRLVHVESRFHERAVSPVGAVGLTQLMPSTAQELQPGVTREEMYDRETNLRLGFRYLRGLLGRYDGRVADALHAYNRGPTTVNRIRAQGGDPANGYADRVLGSGGPEAYHGNGFWSTRAPGATAP